MVSVRKCEGLGQFKEYNVFKSIGRPKARVALVYPSTYQASITNLFTHIAYFYLHERFDSIVVDRFTLDNPSRGALTGLPLRSFDYALISIGFEFDLVGLVKILEANGIEPIKRLRGKEGPVLVAGGPPLMANPLIAAGIADLVFVGDGELLLEGLCDALERGFRGLDTLLDSLESLGIRDSAFTGEEDSVRRARVNDLNTVFIPKPLIRSCSVNPVYGDGYYVEVSRGCPWLCPFCMESYVTYPPRYRDSKLVKDAILEGSRFIRQKRVVFYSLSFFDYPNSVELLEWLLSEGYRYSIPSVRYHTLDENKVRLIRAGGQRTLTLAPETACPLAASLLNKELDLDKLKSLTCSALREGMNVKFYFMFGTPGEGDNAGELAGKLIKDVARACSAERGRIRVSVNPLVPKSGTPMQYVPLLPKEEFNHKLHQLKNEVKGLGVRVESYDWEWAWAQAILSLGGEWVSEFVVRWARRGMGLSALRTTMKECVPDPYFPLKPRDTSTRMPSDIIDWELKEVVRRKGEQLLHAATCL